MAALKGFYEDITLTGGTVEREVEVGMKMGQIGVHTKMKIQPYVECSGEWTRV